MSKIVAHVQRGFSLIELVIVIVIVGLLAAAATVFLKPAIDAYLATQRRSGLSNKADTAFRKMARDIHSAVPNSIRWPSNQCLELVPTSTGGRFRQAADTVNGGSTPLRISQVATGFDVLGSLSATPAVNDWVVIDNQNGNDVYAGTNRAQITAVAAPAVALGSLTISLGATGVQFPAGYTGGRFVVVPYSGGTPSVTYFCSGTGIDASGNGTGSLYRLNQAFNASYPATCPSTAATASLVADHVQSCNFVYNASQDGTLQSGYVYLQMQLTQSNESVVLSYGVHVDNVP
jgi:MSHA biogenesis protein MshO